MVFGSYYYGSGRDQQDQITHLQRENRDLQNQMEDFRRQEQERRERQERETRERARERKERAEEAQYQASDWPEAFAKQLPRLQRELAETVKFNREMAENPDPDSTYQFPPEDTSFWERQIAECQQGRELYHAAQKKYVDKRQEIVAMLERLEQDLLNELAAQVRALHPEYPSELAECLEQNDPSKYLYW